MIEKEVVVVGATDERIWEGFAEIQALRWLQLCRCAKVTASNYQLPSSFTSQKVS